MRRAHVCQAGHRWEESRPGEQPPRLCPQCGSTWMDLEATTSSETASSEAAPTETAASETVSSKTVILSHQQDLLPPAPRSPSWDQQTTIPDKIGRYEIRRLLGAGSFGIVYHGHDSMLDRDVAIKVPKRANVLSGPDRESYIGEARRVAALDHPAIVPVYDVGTTVDGLCYVVSKLIDGQDLQQRCRESAYGWRDAAQLITQVARALAYAHSCGLVHRDIKPANILLDASHRPYLTDFGLARREEDLAAMRSFAGTPAYMSPEQVRGEGHLVDRRTDIFSLGVVFYELLTGRLPFPGESISAIIESIQSAAITPPRTIQTTLPNELQRICLKCLSKRASDRYANMDALVEDLDAFLEHAQEQRAGQLGESRTEPPLVMPKGLRHFDARDADFFLRLLPGPYDRDGLPEQLAFWKSKIEALESDSAFRVGALYGPSGSGKSSIVRAGLLPNLSEHVVSLCLKASAEGTTDQLTALLQSRFSELASQTTAADCVKTLRRSMDSLPGRKVLIVIDQFEQWLQSAIRGNQLGLLSAIRQCDGRRVQCLVVVRDDFWTPMSWFFKNLDLNLVINENAAAMTPFDEQHAQRVLADFGCASGCLNRAAKQHSAAEHEFLARSISELANDGRVNPSELVIFFEIMKHHRWVPSSLKKIGGFVGIGERFLDELFSSPVAPKAYRRHEEAIRDVLRMMLPAEGRSLKGTPRSAEELRSASVYRDRPEAFERLLDILVHETRLLSPVAADSDGVSAKCAKGSVPHFELTHDSLVPALRRWLAERQLGSVRGRAELRLDQRTALWQVRREAKQLPSVTEWLQIECFTRHTRWKDQHVQLMQTARRHHLRRIGLVAICLLAVMLVVRDGMGRYRAERLVQGLMATDNAEVPNYLRQLSNHQRWVPRFVAPYFDESNSSRRQQILARLTMYVAGQSDAKSLFGYLFTADPSLFVILREELAADAEQRTQAAQQILDAWPGSATSVAELGQMASMGERVRFNALACLSAADDRWNHHRAFLANHLLSRLEEQPEQFPELMRMFRPVRKALFPTIVEQLPESNSRQLKWLFRVLATDAPLARRILSEWIEPVRRNDPIARALKQDGRWPIVQGKLHMGLYHVGAPEPLRQSLHNADDLTVRSTIVALAGTVNLDPRTFISWMEQEQDLWVRRATLCILRSYHPRDLGAQLVGRLLDSIDPAWRKSSSDDSLDAKMATNQRWLSRRSIETLLLGISDPGQLAAFQLLVRQWGFGEQLREAVANLADAHLVTHQDWYVEANTHRMRVLGPTTFRMGSPLDEQDRDVWEERHMRRIDRTFAIGTHEVTNRQFQRFAKHVWGKPRCDSHLINNDPDAAATLVSWSDAVAYCNWLSQQSGLPRDQWCYVVRHDSTSDSSSDDVECYDPEQAPHICLQPANNMLSRRGYRLPTEAEWEFACRAGKATPQFFGNSSQLLPYYAWCTSNSAPDLRARPVGHRLPNAFGLFDVYGNAKEWCHDYFQPRFDLEIENGAAPGDVRLDVGGPRSGPYRVLRGLAAGDPLVARSAYREASPDHRAVATGFRIARTIRSAE